MKEAAYKTLVRPILEYGSTVWDPHCNGLNDELENVQKRAARFVTRKYSYETGSMTGILEELKWETLQKRRKDNRLILMYKGLKVKPEILQMTLSQRTGVAEINTQWSFRFPLLVRIPIRKASFPKQSGTVLGRMPSQIHSSPLLNCRTIAYLNSLPLLELGTNLPRPSPGEVLSFLAFHQ